MSGSLGGVHGGLCHIFRVRWRVADDESGRMLYGSGVRKTGVRKVGAHRLGIFGSHVVDMKCSVAKTMADSEIYVQFSIEYVWRVVRAVTLRCIKQFW